MLFPQSNIYKTKSEVVNFLCQKLEIGINEAEEVFNKITEFNSEILSRFEKNRNEELTTYYYAEWRIKNEIRD